MEHFPIAVPKVECMVADTLKCDPAGPVRPPRRADWLRVAPDHKPAPVVALARWWKTRCETSLDT